MVDGKLPWDIHTPLQETCTLQLLRFDNADPHLPNKLVVDIYIYFNKLSFTFFTRISLHIFLGHSGVPVRLCWAQF